MSDSDPLVIRVDGVAEGMWQKVTDKPQGRATHEEWLALPEEEKVWWRARARVVIAEWQEHTGVRLEVR